MPRTFEALGGTLLIAAVVVLAVVAWRARRRGGPASVLAPTILFAFGLLLLSLGWLITPGVPPSASEAIRSAALASAAVLGLYALWLNDQRRRTEQERLATEKERGAIEQSRLAKELEQLGLERVRIVDERFIKAIELLGHDSDRVRIGAFILLDGLARTRPDLVPDVLDQICGYLRGPVDIGPASALEGEQERRVRQRAQRVLAAVLRRIPRSTPVPEIDLSGAALHEFHLTGGNVEVLRLDGAHLTGPTTLRGMFVGELSMRNCAADDDVVIERDQVGGRVDRLVITGKDTRFGGRLTCRCDLGSAEIEPVDFTDSVELADLTVSDRFVAHTDFRRLTLTRVTFAPGPRPDDTSIDLFQCTFRGLVLFDDVEVHGVTRLAGARFMNGLQLGARFHNLVTTEEALVATGTEARLPDGWRREDHDATFQRLVAPVRQDDRRASGVPLRWP